MFALKSEACLSAHRVLCSISVSIRLRLPERVYRARRPLLTGPCVCLRGSLRARAGARSPAPPAGHHFLSSCPKAGQAAAAAVAVAAASRRLPPRRLLRCPLPLLLVSDYSMWLCCCCCSSPTSLRVGPAPRLCSSRPPPWLSSTPGRLSGKQKRGRQARRLTDGSVHQWGRRPAFPSPALPWPWARASGSPA